MQGALSLSESAVSSAPGQRPDLARGLGRAGTADAFCWPFRLIF
jgi:hypothetical protein